MQNAEKHCKNSVVIYFETEIASKCHTRLQDNGSQHIELNMYFWSRQTKIVFSCKT